MPSPFTLFERTKFKATGCLSYFSQTWDKMPSRCKLQKIDFCFLTVSRWGVHGSLQDNQNSSFPWKQKQEEACLHLKDQFFFLNQKQNREVGLILRSHYNSQGPPLKLQSPASASYAPYLKDSITYNSLAAGTHIQTTYNNCCTPSGKEFKAEDRRLQV